MGAHAALGGSGAAHQTDDIPRRHLLALRYRGFSLQAAILGGVAPGVLDDHGGSHELVALDRHHHAAGGGFDGVTLGGLDIQPVVGAPVRHGFVIHQFRGAEHRDGGAVQRRHYLRQQVLRLRGGLLLHGRDLYGLRLEHRGRPLGVIALGLPGGRGGVVDGDVGGADQGEIADGSHCRKAESKGYVEALAAGGAGLGTVDSAHSCLSVPAQSAGSRMVDGVRHAEMGHKKVSALSMHRQRLF